MLQHPLVIAHRGASRFAPENTLAAFELAARQGAHAIELDAKLSSDGVVVVHHDQTLERTTNGSGALAEKSAAYLTALDAGSHYDPQYAGEKLPTLEQVFAAVGSLLLINVELTNYATPGDELVEKTVDLVKAFHLEERVIFSSFLPGNLRKAGRLLPQTPRAMLALAGFKGALSCSFWMVKDAPQALNPYYSDVTTSLVRKEHARGRKVFPWTVNEPTEMTRLLDAGVDGLITDDPPAALALLQNRLKTAGSPTSEGAPARTW